MQDPPAQELPQLVRVGKSLGLKHTPEVAKPPCRYGEWNAFLSCIVFNTYLQALRC